MLGMPSSNPNGKCIYCLLPQATFSKEHVLQFALGGSLTLTDCVCAKCNTGFSMIDNQLSDYSVVSIARVAMGPAGRKKKEAASKYSNLMVDPTTGLMLDVRLKQQYRPELKPQFIIGKDRKTIHFATDPALSCGVYQTDFTNFLDALDKFGIGKVTIVTETWGYDLTPRVVQESATYFYARAATTADGQRLLNFLADPAKNAALRSQIGSVTTGQSKQMVNSGIRMDTEMTFRAVAKIALNYLAKQRGASVVLEARFNPIRSFILNGLPGFKPDTNPFIHMPRLESKPFKALPNTHFVTLMKSNRRIFAYISFYEHFDFLVDLGPAIAKDEPVESLTFFNHTDRTTMEISVADFRRFRPRFYRVRKWWRLSRVLSPWSIRACLLTMKALFNVGKESLDRKLHRRR